ncbi:MAG: ATP-binding protein [Candidatus Nanoarchaeia archaeon]|nr:ATP-binding protein [Candidatus Nanoarchaeia archaeon]
MLIEFKVSNFLSIKDEVVLSLDSASISNLKENTFQELDYSLLKTIVIYGANASGKSNIMKALFFACQMIKESVNFKVDTEIPRVPFLLNNDTKLKPTNFEFTFIKNEVRYIYGFSCDKRGFVEEYLKYKPKGENLKTYYIRDENKEERFKFYVDSKLQTNWGKETILKRLYLPVAVNDRNYEALKDVYDYFLNDIIIVFGILSQWRDYTRDKLIQDVEFKSWVLEIMKKADFGGILDLKIEKKKVPPIELKNELGQLLFRALPDEQREIFDLSFIHKDEDGKFVEFKENLESSGTRKTLDILGQIYNILQTGKTLFIDEFELYLHPNITEFIIRLFQSKHNKKNGQLVVTTHDTTLLKNKGLFRRDQVYICSKDPNKATELNSLDNFDLRESLSFENAYLNGRVGGLPFIDENFFE